jgi:ankyrin repeat protein
MHLNEHGQCSLVRDSIWDDIMNDRGNFLNQYPVLSCQNLGEAANVGEANLVAEMLTTGQDVNQTFEKGETALLRACRYGHLKVVEALLNSGADPRIASASNKTPLHFLPAFDDQDIPRVAALLLEHNASLEVSSIGDALDLFCDTPLTGTPLQWAVEADNKPACEALIEAGANPWSHGTRSSSAIARAAERHQYYLLETLLSASHVQSQPMRPLSADVRSRRLETDNGDDEINSMVATPIVHAMLDFSQQALTGATFGRLTLHGEDYQQAYTETLRKLLGHGYDPGPAEDSVLDLALQLGPPFAVEWVVEWYRSHNKPIPENINNSVGVLVSRNDRRVFDYLLKEKIVPPSRTSLRHAAIVRVAGYSDNPYYLSQYVKAEQALGKDANLNFTIAFEQAVINGKYTTATYLFEARKVDLLPYKAGNQYHDAANILGRFLERSKRFMNIEKRAQFVAELTERAFIAAGEA